MESISPSDLAIELLNHCLRGSSWPVDLLETLLRMASHPDEDRARAGSHALFSIVVERLGDLFEPALCDTYASLFSHVIEYVRPEYVAAELLERYRRVRMPRRFEGDAARVENVFVLSRVTLGADVAITSVLLDAAKQRFPRASVQFVGTHKSYELFAADPRVKHVPISYGRTATLRERLSVWPELEHLLRSPRSIVVDPDSRLTQLGLLPVCPEDNYFFFESRGYGEYGPEPLCALTKRWARETFDVECSRPYIAPSYQAEEFGDRPITVSFGVGENPAKRIRDPFEEELLRALLQRGSVVVIDKGAGGDEKERVERAVARSGAKEGQVRTRYGPFAPFAASIAASRLYVGYDSAGQHVAAACGVPLVTVFSGFVSPRMLNRWHPSGSGPIAVVPVHDPDPAIVLAETLRALDRVA
ncbi:MAG: glycosyltransferase family 9 protein [Bryobacteraceae bacterium]|nr:glycosyltransferase family 9 protein [Bryobacteraceae bacterium]